MAWLLAFIGQHPLAIAIGILLFIGSCLAVGWFFAWWADRVERQQQVERQRLQRIIQASEAPREWPRRRGPHGFKSR